MAQDSHSGPNTSLVSNNEYDVESQEFRTLSGKKPFFYVIFAKSHLHPLHRLALQAKIQPVLPSVISPVVLTYGAKEWNMTCHGNNSSCKGFDASWRKFVDDNSLKIGDACLFELKECNFKLLVFRVQILGGDIPLNCFQRSLVRVRILPSLLTSMCSCPLNPPSNVVIKD